MLAVSRMNKPLSGLIAAPHTPFRADGSIDYDVIPQQARLLAANGVSGAFICGTTARARRSPTKSAGSWPKRG